MPESEMRSSTVTNSDLIRAGFSQDQALVLHDYLQDRALQDYRNLASSSDLKVLGSELRLETANLRQEMTELHADVKQDIAEVRLEVSDLRTELKQDIADLRTE
ncbi:MAG: hypothetical protein ORO03_11500, partial [Alphaproteobacteria bacterium]|nr:hypothetical protein [Alphaproteobacteria bacterium]